MVTLNTIRDSFETNRTVRQWVSRAFIISILAYLVVLGYLVAEAVLGASKWAPYGVNMPLFIALIVASEVVIAATAVWIFKEDSGIWPPSIAEGWSKFRAGSRIAGAKQILGGAWDVSIIDLRLRTPMAIFLGRANRVAALVPLVYALVVSFGNAPWGLQSSAIVDIVLTLGVWAFMEIAMVRPERAATHTAGAGAINARAAGARKQSRYEVRPLTAGDIDRVEDIEHIKWKDQAATRDKVLSRLRVFPQGQLAAVHISMVGAREARRSVVAWSTVMPANGAQVRSFRSWDRVTSNGTIADADPSGDVLVGVNLTSVTEGATYILLGEVLAAVVEWGKRKLIGGSRLNGFAAFNDHRRAEGKRLLTADGYARLREIRGFRCNERQLDLRQAPLSDDEYVRVANDLRFMRGEPELAEDERPDYVCSNLRGYMSIPGARMVEVVPEYFADPSSSNYGVVIEWSNPLPRPFRHIGPMKRWLASRIRKEIQGEWDLRKHRMTRRRQAAPVLTPATHIAIEPAGSTEDTAGVAAL